MMRSRTPTLTQSIDLKQTTDKDLKVFVRPAKTIKNPFLMEKFTVAKGSKSFLIGSNQPKIGHHENKLLSCKGIEPPKDDDVPSVNSSEGEIKVECVNDDYQFKYFEEVGKHQATKQALDKAIQLANLLLDELQLQDLKSNNNSFIYASTNSLSRFQTPEPSSLKPS
jgi:DNA-directed RNA polymerase specialized sigma54-like protein